jgi:holo-[acyl-carrier protein] synthase
MQIYGIGTDIVQCERINKLWAEHGINFAQRILTDYELAAFADQKTNQVGFLAKRFAAKEAIAKALGTGFRDDVFITQVGIETDSKGKPVVKFYAKTKEYVANQNIIDVHISISDESEYVVAFVIITRAS